MSSSERAPALGFIDRGRTSAGRVAFGALHATAMIVGLLVVVPVEGARPPSGLRLVLELEKARYAPFAPVVVDYSLRNLGDQPVSVPSAIDPSFGFIKFEVTDRSGRFQPYRTGLMAHGWLQTVTLLPGATLTGEVRIVSNQNADLLSVGQVPGDRGAPFPFAEPGSYSVRARFGVDGTGTPGARILESNTVTVVVREANTRDREALQLLPSRNSLAVALGGETVSGEGPVPGSEPRTLIIQRWEELVERFGDTAYAPFVRLTLASYYRADGILPKVRPDLAVAHLQSVVKSGPRFIVDDALLGLAKAALAEGHVDKAQSAVTKLLRDFPNSENAVRARHISDGLKAGYRTLNEIEAQ